MGWHKCERFTRFNMQCPYAGMDFLRDPDNEIPEGRRQPVNVHVPARKEDTHGNKSERAVGDYLQDLLGEPEEGVRGPGQGPTREPLPGPGIPFPPPVVPPARGPGPGPTREPQTVPRGIPVSTGTAASASVGGHNFSMEREFEERPTNDRLVPNQAFIPQFQGIKFPAETLKVVKDFVDAQDRQGRLEAWNEARSSVPFSPTWPQNMLAEPQPVGAVAEEALSQVLGKAPALSPSGESRIPSLSRVGIAAGTAVLTGAVVRAISQHARGPGGAVKSRAPRGGGYFQNWSEYIGGLVGEGGATAPKIDTSINIFPDSQF